MYHISLLSKAETQFLNGQKHVSKSYEYKLKSTIRRKITDLLDKEIPLLSKLFPNFDLTTFSKVLDDNNRAADLTKNSKIANSILPLYQICIMDFDTLPQVSIKNHNKPSQCTSREDNEQLYIKSKKKINNYNTRAGGLAWLRYRLDMAGVVGSNPTRPIYESKLV
jgi:hypothetical protein